MNIYEELAVLEEGDDGAIVAIRGQGGPCVLLGPEYLGHLAALLSQVNGADRLLQYPDYAPLVTLQQEMQRLLRTYDETCNKYEGSPSPKKSIAQIVEELEAMAARLERI